MRCARSDLAHAPLRYLSLARGPASFDSRLLAALGFVLISLICGTGRAHTAEYLRNIALHPTDPKVFVVRYEAGLGGLLFSRDGGKSVQMVPGQSFYTYPLRYDVPLLFAGDGKLQLALDDGLRVDDTTFCGLSRSEPALDKLWIADLAPHPSDPNTTFLVTTGDTKGAHAGLWTRSAQGVIAPLGVSEPPLIAGRLPFRASSLKVVARAASVDGLRFLETGVRMDDSTSPATATPVLRVSDDRGLSWTTHVIPDPDKTGGMPRLLLVDGSEPFKALVTLNVGWGDYSPGPEPNDPIFVTRDGGASFAPYLDQLQMAGEALLLPSGQILLADRGIAGGLWSAASFDSPASKIGDEAVHCLAYQEATQKIFMCRAHEVGFYDLAERSFCALFQLSDVDAFVSCPAAPIALNKKAIDQLCGSYCAAQHFAAADVCTTFEVGSRLCGLTARAYDAEASYVPPPYANQAPRCAPLASAPDAGASSSEDAGSEAEPPADEPEDDQGSELNEDEEAESDDDADAGQSKKKKKKKHKGCQLTRVGEPAPAGAQLSGLLALALVMALRRRFSRIPQRNVRSCSRADPHAST